MKDLQAAFDHLRAGGFPDSPDSDDLQDLYAELVELDGYIAGLVSSRLKGVRKPFDLKESFAPIEAMLAESANTSDAGGLGAIRVRYDKLRSLAETLAKYV